MQTLADRIRDGHPALVRAQVPRHLLEQVQECYRCPWFLCADSEQIAFPLRSVFPGQPIADVLFELLMAECMADIRSRLQDAGHSITVPSARGRKVGPYLGEEAPTESEQLLDVEFADDGTLMFITPAA